MVALHAAFLLFACVFVAHLMQARYALPREARATLPLCTFVVDPATFFAVGLIAALVAFAHCRGHLLSLEAVHRRTKVLNALLVLFVAGFWTMEVLTYFDLLDWHRGLYPDKSGNWFMWNGYLDLVGIGEVVDTTVPTYEFPGMNALALAFLLAQLPFLLWGRALGRAAFTKK